MAAIEGPPWYPCRFCGFAIRERQGLCSVCEKHLERISREAVGGAEQLQEGDDG